MNITTKFDVDDEVYWSEPSSRLLHKGRVTAINIVPGGLMYKGVVISSCFYWEDHWYAEAFPPDTFELTETELFKSEKLLRTRGKRLILEHEIAWYTQGTESLKGLLDKHVKQKSSLLYDLKCLDRDIKIEENGLIERENKIQELKKELEKFRKEIEDGK